jgi:DNA glycosylase AlkZ-like
MLALTAPRVHALSAYYHRQQELDAAIFAKSHDLLTKALQGQKQLTRQEISNVLRDGSIPTTGFRLGFILMHAELEALICSGALRGKQHTYALLSERAPQAKTLTPDEALAELVRRYFTSHGPATLKDFAWWSGLTIADANAGIASVKSQLAHEKIDGSEYWFAPSTPAPQEAAPICYLLSDYDEYIIAYTNRTAYLLDPQRTYRANLELNRPVTMNGYVVGTWKRTIKTKMVNVEIELFTPLQPAETRARRRPC